MKRSSFKTQIGTGFTVIIILVVAAVLITVNVNNKKIEGEKPCQKVWK